MREWAMAGPDAVVAALLRVQLARLHRIDAMLAAWCAHPPGVSEQGWSGPAAAAHDRAATRLRARLVAAREQTEATIALTHAALLRAGG